VCLQNTAVGFESVMQTQRRDKDTYSCLTHQQLIIQSNRQYFAHLPVRCRVLSSHVTKNPCYSIAGTLQKKVFTNFLGNKSEAATFSDVSAAANSSLFPQQLKF